MAKGGNVPKLGGYDYEFTSKVPEDWICLICQLALKDPVQIVGCGHRLCKTCMDSLLSHPFSKCPADRKPLLRAKIFPDTGCHRQILDLTVKCSHSGCSWTGELRAVEKHQSECLFKVVKCPNSGCAKMLTKRDMKTHETLECPWRNVDCEYCEKSVIVNQKQKHFNICQKFPVQCTDKCGMRDIPREKLEVHVRDECPATEVQCEYKNLGCKEVFPRSGAKSHSQSQIESHLNLALRCIEATQHHVHQLATMVREQSQQLELQSGQLERLISTVQNQSQQKEQLISKDKEQSEQLKRSLSTVQDQATQGEQRGPINQIFPTPFEWKIYLNRPNSIGTFGIKEFVSEKFYLFERSYKYLLKICCAPCGSLLQVYIKVVPGEFDDLLLWPCKEKVRVTLINKKQLLRNSKNISVVIDFGKDMIPSYLPQHDDHHEYRLIGELRVADLPSRSYILISANRE